MIAARLVAIAGLVAACAHEPTREPTPRAPRGRPGAPPPMGAVVSRGEIVIEDDLGLLPNVRLDTVQVASGLDLAAVVERLRTELPALRSCFRSQVTPRPRAALTLSLSLRIGGSGEITDANVRGSEVPALRHCLASALVGKTGFPRPAGGGSAAVEASLLVTPVR